MGASTRKDPLRAWRQESEVQGWEDSLEVVRRGSLHQHISQELGSFSKRNFRAHPSSHMSFGGIAAFDSLAPRAKELFDSNCEAL